MRENDRSAYVYIMASWSGTLYVGSTVDLEGRTRQHKIKAYPKSFTAKYGCTRLVYIEEYDDLSVAREREYQIKQWNREKKMRLIRLQNAAWIDLSISWERMHLRHPPLR